MKNFNHNFNHRSSCHSYQKKLDLNQKKSLHHLHIYFLPLSVRYSTIKNIPKIGSQLSCELFVYFSVKHPGGILCGVTHNNVFKI